ncbi:rho GTPase-activating protein 32-like, partial [Gallus gallus]|uniref:rho GTPase-activating protein 32-like n=1 Tax=Gallus gallus TaxID=9031 RepID=UPI001AE7C98B
MSVLCTSTEDRAIFCGTKSWFCRSFGCKCGMRVPFLQAILSWFNGGGLRSAAFSLPSLFLFLFQVGFFPGECVELINGKIPEALIDSAPKPVPKKRGKLISFLRSFAKARPKEPKQREMAKEKEGVFGCDLGEHLLHSGRDVPQVLQSCAEFIEQHGVVQGIYRLSGVASKIQKLRHEFESEQIPELSVRDVHSVSSLCKMYFRELPTPLLTEQLYGKFSDAVCAATDEERLLRMQEVIQ